MQNVLTWLDVLALFSVAAATAVGVRKGVSFFLVFPLALGIFVLVLYQLKPPPYAWPFIGFLAGLFAAQLAGRWFIYLSPFWDGLLGGLAGFAWGLLIAFSLWMGLPMEYSNATGAYRYPSPNLPLVVQEAVVKSPFALPLFEKAQSVGCVRNFLLKGQHR